MKLHALQDVTLTNLDARFRQSPLTQFMASFVFAAFVAGAVYWYWAGDLSLFGAILLGGVMFVMGLMFFRTFKKALAPTNWILAIGPDRVLVKFRSYRNSHFPSRDPQVVSLDPSEILLARMTRQRLKGPGSHSRRKTSYHTFLDLQIDTVDLTPLRQRLNYERNLIAHKMGQHASAKARYYPVSVDGIDTIRIEWRSSSDIVVPGIRKALAILNRQGIPLKSVPRQKIDLTPRRRIDLSGAEDKILYLAQRGRLLDAADLARRTYKFSFTEAKQFVEDLLR
jgi:hypothetical protein